MADPVKLTIDGREIQAAPGTLVIDAAKQNGIEVPAFCYYEGLSLQAACRMCLVEIEKTPKLQTACTVPVAEGMVVRTETPQVAQARKYMLEYLLTNHPLDCPVCDKGGECELQDMTFRYGVGESRFAEEKMHVDEEQWSPVVFYDRPRCILCYRCVRICDEGMGVSALGVGNRGVISEILPNEGNHLNCDECGMCIDICPVGALTSGMYRYKTRPWEMEHVGTICTHCSNGCKTTLGVRNGEIIRGNNRDHSGINGEFLCLKGRFAFDFVQHPERLQSPLMRKGGGPLEPVSWSEALAAVAAKFKEVRDRGGNFGVIGSNHTSNEENYFLQKFARQVLGTANIDHHRTGDIATLMDALSGRANALATTAAVPELPGARQLPASRSAHLHHHARTNARRQVRDDGPRGAAGPRDSGARTTSRIAEQGGRPRHPVRRRDPGRCGAEAGGVRRFARHSGEIRGAGGLFQFPWRFRHGAAARSWARIPGSGEAGAGVRSDPERGRSRRALGGWRESATANRARGGTRLCSGSGPVPYRNGATRGCGVSGSFGLRKVGHGDQRLWRGPAAQGGD